MREVRAASWKYDVDNAAIDKTPSSDSSMTVAGENTRVVLSSVFAFCSWEYASGGGPFAGTSFTDFPRVYFRDATSSPSTVFAVPCTAFVGPIGTAVVDVAWNQSPGLLIPGPGVLFENGLSLSVQAPSTSSEASVTVNILYQV